MRGIFLLFAFITFSMVSCEKGMNDNNANKVEEGLYNAHLVEKNYEQKSFELYAERINPLNDTIFAEHIKVIFFNTMGDTSSTLFAKKGWYVENTGNVEAIGDVRVFSKKGDSLFTDTLLYKDSTRKIIAPSHVVIYRSGEKIRGRDLVSDAAFKHVIIGGKVLGERRKKDTKSR